MPMAIQTVFFLRLLSLSLPLPLPLLLLLLSRNRKIEKYKWLRVSPHCCSCVCSVYTYVCSIVYPIVVAIGRLDCAVRKIDVLPHKNKASEEESPECVFVESNIVNFMTFLCAEIYKLCKLTLTAVNRRLSDTPLWHSQAHSRTPGLPAFHPPLPLALPLPQLELLIFEMWKNL